MPSIGQTRADYISWFVSTPQHYRTCESLFCITNYTWNLTIPSNCIYLLQPQEEFEGITIPIPPVIQLSAERVDSTGVYLLEDSDTFVIFIGQNVSPSVCQTLLGYPQFSSIPDNLVFLFYKYSLNRPGLKKKSCPLIKNNFFLRSIKSISQI